MAELSLRHERMNDVFEKWHIEGLPFAAAFHHFTGLENEGPHSHPWAFRSEILSGSYVEHVYQIDGSYEEVHRKPGDVFANGADHIHKLVSLPEGECWTLIIPGPAENKSGFYRFEDGKAFHRFWDEAEFRPLDEHAEAA